MREYDLKRKALRADDRDKRTFERIGKRDGLLLDRDQIRSYAVVNLHNPRLRELVDRVLPTNAELLLWIPPTLSYLVPEEPFLIGRRDLKVLAFSSWQLAPEAIAALVSYEVERRLVRHQVGRRAKHGRTKRRPLNFENYSSLGDRLRFGTRSDGVGDQVGHGLSPLALLYPSTAVADLIDPLNTACARAGPVPIDDALLQATKRIKEAMQGLPRTSTKGRPDERWYWAAPILLDGPKPVSDWLASRDPFGFQSAKGAERDEVRSDEVRMREAIDGLLDGSWTLGRKPRDLAKVLARMALGAPGVCAVRALKRTMPEETKDETRLKRAAFKIARGFQSLFNQPEAVLAVTVSTRGRQPYWPQAISYAIAGNLQALLDEQAHMEADGLSLLDEPAAKKLEKAGNNLAAPLRLRYAGIEVAGLGRRRRMSGSTGPRTDVIRMRGRHAARFAEIKEDDGTVTQLDAISRCFQLPLPSVRPRFHKSGPGGSGFSSLVPCCVSLEPAQGTSGARAERGTGTSIQRSRGASERRASYRLGRSRYCPRECERGSMDQDVRTCGPVSAARACTVLDIRYGQRHIKVRRFVPMPALGREADEWPLLTRRLALYRLVLGQPRAGRPSLRTRKK